MAKKKKNISDQDAYQAFLNDQAKQKEEQAKGQVRYREAAQASRIQYTNPTYQGNSKNGNYKWETEALKTYKMPKGMGRSYNDKFDYMTRKMGMSEGESDDFRRYLDFQEDKGKSKYALQKYELDKAGNPTRHSYEAGPGLHTKQEIIDGILSGMTQKAVQATKNFKANTEAEQKAAEAKKQAKVTAETDALVAKENGPKKKSSNPILNVVDKINDGLGTAYDNTLGRLDRFFTSEADAIALGQLKKNVEQGKNKGNPIVGDAPEFVKKASLPATNKVDKTMDVLGELVGSAAPIGAAYKPAGLLAKTAMAGKDAKYIEAALRGGTAMGLYSGAKQGLDEVIHPEDADLKQRLTDVGINTALGAVGDPALLGLSKALNLKGITGKLSDDVANQLADNLARETPESALLNPVRNSDKFYDSLINPPKVTPEPAPQQIAPDPIVQNEPQINDDIVQQALKQKELTNNPAEHDALDNLIESITGKRPAPVRNLKADEDAFVAEQMKPHHESLQKAADAQTQWENIVKKSKEQSDHIKQTFGKIYVPSHSLEDYPVPKQFLAGAKDKHSDDIFSFADQMGFSSPDEAVAFLQSIDADGKMKLKDLMPEGTVDAKDLKYLEESFRKQFRNENVNNSQKVDQALEQINSPKVETEAVSPAPVSESQTAGKPETSSNMDTLGIRAGQAHVNDISWVEDPLTLKEKISSGKVTAETTTRKLKTELSSDLQPVKDAERAIADMDDQNVLEMLPGKNDVSANDSLFKGLRAVRRSISEAMKSAKDDYGSILKTLRKNKISKRDFDEYASAVHFKDVLDNNHDLMERAGEVAQRLEEIEALGQATNDRAVLKPLADEEKALLKEKNDLEPYVLPASATPENVQRVLDRWASTPAMQQAQRDFMAAQRKDLQLLVDSGLYTPEAAQAMIDKHPNYIYMGRAKDEVTFGAGGNSSKPNQFVIKRKKGSDENLKYSPLESAVRNRLLTFSNARRNQAMQKIEKLAQVNGAKDFFNEINPHTASDSQMKNSVKFFVDGKEVRYEVPTSLKNAFENIDTKNAQDLVSNSLRAVANITRKGATYFNTDFIFASPFRDATGLITSRTGLHPGEMVLGYMDSFMGKGLERISGGKFKSYKSAYEKMGGHQAGFVTLDPQSTKAFMKAIDKGTLGNGIKVINPKNWPEVITKFGGAIEHGPKLAEFRSAKNKGYGDADAMHEAVDVIDYTDQGSTIRKWNDKVPFLNPAIRGNVRYFQAAKENFPKWLGKNMLYITTPTVGIYMMRFAPTTSDGQRSKLRNLSEFQKNSFWYIPVPNSKDDSLLAIPKMHTAAQLFGNPVERVLDTVFDDNPKTVARILKDTGADSLNALIPPSAVAGISSIKNAIANYDPLMDMPIEDLSMQHEPDKTKHFNSFTSELAKKLGGVTGQSPAKIDYLIKSLTGGTGRDVLDVSDNLLAKTGAVDRPQKVDTILDILNPVRRYEYKDTSGLETSKDLYDQQLRDGKGSEAANFYADIKSISKEIKGIREDKEMSSEDKKKAIANLREQQRQIGDSAIKSGILKNR